jgi:hypothetical protein
MWSNTLNSLHIRRFCESDQLDQYVPSAVQLIYEAAFSYFDLLFGGREEALAELSHWTKRPSSEYSILRATGVLQKEICLGIVIGIGGQERNRCHKADILALLNSTLFASDRLRRHPLKPCATRCPRFLPMFTTFVQLLWRGTGAAAA